MSDTDLSLDSQERFCPTCLTTFRGQDPLCPVDRTLLISIADRLQIGEILDGRYKILSIASHSASSTLYKASDLTSQQTVAIKLLDPSWRSNQESVNRFRHAANAIAKFSHPHIVSLYDFVVPADGHCYWVQEWVDGVPLQQVIEEHGPLPEPRGLSIFLQVCEALSHAHEHRVIHRNLKPSNVLLTRQGDDPDFVKLSDFGIAKEFAMQGQQSLKVTKTGKWVGSPLYMSPEQCMGSPLDPRSDIYSLGCVMMEAFGGRISFPHDGEAGAQLHISKVQSQSDKSSNFSTGISQGLQAVILHACNKAPGDRYQSAREIMADLQLIKAGKPPAVPSPALSVKGQTSRSSSKALVALLTGKPLYTGLIAILFIAGIGMIRTPSPPSDPQTAAAYLQRGLDYSKHEQWQQAKDDFTKAIDLDPKMTRAYLERATAYEELGRYWKEIEDCDKAIKLAPGNAAAYGRRGYARSNLEQYEKAIEDYNKSLNLDSQQENTYLNRGIAFDGLGQYQKAIDDYNKAISLDPTDSNPYNNRGFSYSEMGKYQRAIEDYTKALSLDRTHLKAHNNRGDAYSEIGEYQKAVNDYTEATTLDPKEGYSFFRRALVYEKLGMLDLAGKDRETSAKLGYKP